MVSEDHGDEDTRTVAFDRAVNALDHATQVRPFGQVLEVEADVVCLRQVVQVGGRDVEQVVRPHWPDGRHFGFLRSSSSASAGASVERAMPWGWICECFRAPAGSSRKVAEVRFTHSCHALATRFDDLG
jgi:hypothetical protein